MSTKKLGSENLLSFFETIEGIKAEIKEEYRQAHDKPWLVGFSGGKDSTIMLHLVIESLLELPWSERRRKIFVVTNDTLVESPIVQNYVNLILSTLKTATCELDLPISTVVTTPAQDQTFWVNLIGRGYPSPTRMFRWCTDRMKIKPTTQYIREQVSSDGAVILLLGVRRAESSARSQSAKRYDNGRRLNRHNDIVGCYVFRPILELFNEDVWQYLLENDPPWGGGNKNLINLYKNAVGGECPLVIDPDAAPSCGSSSVRFGCWTCTVVDKDKSFRNSMENGFEYLEPMANFRDWLKTYCYQKPNRMTRRRNGQAGLGPLTFEARKKILDYLIELEQSVGHSLITKKEIDKIKCIWAEDNTTTAIQAADSLLEKMGEL